MNPPFPDIGSGESAVAIPLRRACAAFVKASKGRIRIEVATSTLPHGFPRYAYAVPRREAHPIPGIPYGKAFALLRTEYVDRTARGYVWILGVEAILDEPILLCDLGISSMDGAEWRYARKLFR